MLRPLLLDSVPTIQQTAALALGRLADHSDDLAEALVRGDILPQLVHSLTAQNVSVSPYRQMSGTLQLFRSLQCGCLHVRQNGRVCGGLNWQSARGSTSDPKSSLP